MSQVEETTNPQGPHIPIERVQTGARMEKNLVKVLKALAGSLTSHLGICLKGSYYMLSSKSTPLARKLSSALHSSRKFTGWIMMPMPAITLASRLHIRRDNVEKVLPIEISCKN